MEAYSVARKLGTDCIMYRKRAQGDAVMFDIDDTLLHANGTPIPDMISLLRICKYHGYYIVIITARPSHEMNRMRTREELISNGIFPDVVYFAPAEEKTACKRQTNLHYVLSVGDMKTDLHGGDYFIKLPDVDDKNVYSNIPR